ncbi:TonB-dependent receptor [Pseudomonas sp. CGJS7]|uniref:TonB-dependent receptor n=1 Tax=Pseudomonas sp. CGJS7 TaxID=3109348 RepID=UPI0030097DE8
MPAHIALALAVVSAPSHAQSEQTGGGNKQATTLDRVEVVGSRIKRADLETSQPVFTLSREEIQKQGLTSIADVLQRISTNGAALNRTFNNGGDGSASISLRNLGAKRTLVLLNGRRWSTQLDGSVDLNTIPSAIIERVEVLKDGASTIYGSDAIAGVVNIVTRSNYEGAEASAYIGQFGQGDGGREAYDFTLGVRNDRGSLLLGASYVKEDEVMAGARKISAGGPPFFGGQSPVGVPGSFVDPKDNKTYILGPNGQFVPFNSDVHGYNTAPDNYMLTPQERTGIFAQGLYDITDKVTFRSEFLYNQRTSEQLLAAMPVSGYKLSKDSIYNPTKGTANPRDLTTSRRYVESGGRSFNQDVKTFHFYGGFEGVFDVGERQFNWDVGYRYDRTDENSLTYGLFNKQAINNAMGPSFIDAGGVARCGTPSAIIQGCVPINPLGPIGSISKQALDYISFTAHDSTKLESKSYTLNVTGDLFDLPAGPLSFAAGYERRSESGQFDPDAFIASGQSTGNGTKPTKGSYSLDDLYLELSVPVLKDLPFAKLLDFSLATRRSDYDTFGSTLNSKFGFRWKPFDDLMIRGNWAEGFRAPDIIALYRGDADSFESYADPCSRHSGRRSNAAINAKCLAEGLPASFEQPGSGSSRQTREPFTFGSNPDLMPETSTSTTLGFVYNPSWLPGFDISVDWYRIKIKDAITTPTVRFILDKCYTGTAAEQAIYCKLFKRDMSYPGSPGIITDMDLRPMNAAQYEVEGYDMTMHYRLPETRWGKFAISWDTTYTARWDFKATKDSEAEKRLGRYFGGDRDPYWRIRSNLNLDWTYGDFGATWGMRYMSGLEEECPQAYAQYCSNPKELTNRLPATTYHDVQFRYNTPWNATVAVGSNNVFAKEPPLALTAPYNQFDPQYDVPGRFYYLQYRQRF